MELTSKDCEILVEAVDCWVEKGLMGMVLGGIFTGLNRDEMSRKQEQQKLVDEYNEGKKRKLETARLIQAKLVLLKDKIQINEITK